MDNGSRLGLRGWSRKLGACLAAAVMALAVGTAVASTTAAAQELTAPMYRLYNPWSGEHLFTQDQSEVNGLVPLGWRDEGTAWLTPTSGTDVYRLYNPYSGDHFYTSDRAEYDQLGSIGWNKEGTSFYSADKDVAGAKPIYRLFNKWLTQGTHLFTTDKGEYDNLSSIGWNGENIAFYGFGTDLAKPQPLVIDESGYYQDNSGVVHTAVVLHNPNASYEADFAQIEVTCYDNNGAVIGDEKHYVSDTLPGDKASYITDVMLSGSKNLSRVSFQIIMSENSYTFAKKASAPYYRVSNNASFKDNYGATHFTGNVVANSSVKELNNASIFPAINVLYRDTQGKLIGGVSRYQSIPVGQQTAFEVTTYNAPNFASYEVTVAP